MGKKMEIEQLYEYNLQLRDNLNKLKKELAETKYQVVKKEIESRENEKNNMNVEGDENIEEDNNLREEKNMNVEEENNIVIGKRV